MLRLCIISLILFLSGCNLVVENSGGGLVTSDDENINCGQVCSFSYSSDATVTLVATAESGYVFDSWGGVCAEQAECVVSVGQFSGNKSVTAQFSAIDTVDIILTVENSGGGVVTSNDGSIDCGSACQSVYEVANQTISLTATADPGYVFDGWSGDCSEQVCVVSIGSNSGDKAVTATFSVIEGYSSLSLSGNYSCSVKSGKPNCFGKYPGGNAGGPAIPAGLGVVDEMIVSGGTYYGYNCVLSENKVSCWNSTNKNAPQEELAGELTNPTGLAMYYGTGCVIDEGLVKCWGSGPAASPTEGLNNASMVTVGDQFACAIANGDVACWGDAPSVVTPFQNPRYISAYNENVCVLDDSGGSCFGPPGSNIDLPILLEPAAIALSENHGCAITGVGVVCWGDNDQGQGTVPVALENPYAIAAGLDHTCAVGTSGVKCWGANYYGQSTSAVHLGAPAELFMQNSYAKNGFCVKNNEDLHCFGLASPTQPSVHSISFGAAHRCTLVENGTPLHDVACSGDNTAGQLNLPFTQASRIELGDYFTCLVGANDRVECVGYNSASNIQNTPDIQGVTKMTSGNNQICALHSDGVSCWGGSAPPSTAIDPTDVAISSQESCAVAQGRLHCYSPFIPNLSDVTAVELTSGFGCAISAGKVVCWGGNNERATAVPEGLENVTKIGVTDQETCAINDKGLTCWGTINLSPSM